MTQEEMNLLVPEKLREIEETCHVTVLWACESGSRAWGFASPDSDYDVRFLYKRRMEDYLKLERIRDVIELPVDAVWDVSGWDLNKTLGLLKKSNPMVFEWLNSPIVYCSSGFRERIDPLLKEYFSEERMLHHYLNTAKSNLVTVTARETVRAKKYFYVLRPLLACAWIMKYHEAPPVPFETLCALLPEEVRPAVQALLAVKTASREAEEVPQDPVILKYLQETIRTAEAYLQKLPDHDNTDWEDLDRFFLQEIRSPE